MGDPAEVVPTGDTTLVRTASVPSYGGPVRGRGARAHLREAAIHIPGVEGRGCGRRNRRGGRRTAPGALPSPARYRTTEPLLDLSPALPLPPLLGSRSGGAVPHDRENWCLRHPGQMVWVGPGTTTETQQIVSHDRALFKAERMFRHLVTRGHVSPRLHARAWEMVRDNAWLTRPEGWNAALSLCADDREVRGRAALYAETITVLEVISDAKRVPAAGRVLVGRPPPCDQERSGLCRRTDRGSRGADCAVATPPTP